MEASANERARRFLPLLPFCDSVWRRRPDTHTEKTQVLSNRKCSDGTKPQRSVLSVVFTGWSTARPQTTDSGAADWTQKTEGWV